MMRGCEGIEKTQTTLEIAKAYFRAFDVLATRHLPAAAGIVSEFKLLHHRVNQFFETLIQTRLCLAAEF